MRINVIFFLLLSRAIQMVMREILEYIAVGWAAEWKLLLESHSQNRLQIIIYRK